MRRTILGSAVVLLSLVSTAQAQYRPVPQAPNPYGPRVSPYLNLLNRQTNPAINYYGIVRPQVQFNQAIQQQQADLGLLRQQNNVGQLRQEIDQLPARLRQDLAARQPAPTPIPTFVNYSHYYAMPQPQGRR